jgi:hypothetical protein
MPPPSLLDLDWGSVPAWLGAGSLLLAFRIFWRDRSNAERSQVDLVGALGATEYERRAPDVSDRVEKANAHLFVRNASELPIEVAQLACDLRTTWLVPDGQLAYRPVPGVQPHRSFIERIVVAPQVTWDGTYSFDIAHLAPENAVQLDLIRGCVVVIRWLLIIDNAGRKWEVRPSSGTRARRVRWYQASRGIPAGLVGAPTEKVRPDGGACGSHT